MIQILEAQSLFSSRRIRLLFSIADIDTPESEFEGEEGEGEQANEDAQDPSFPIRAAITVTKVAPLMRSSAFTNADKVHCLFHIQAGKGALSIDAIIQDGAFIVDNISFYDNAKLATDNTAEADWARRGLYIGPQVCNA